MFDKRFAFVVLCISMFTVLEMNRDAIANDYVWSRTAFGSSAAGRHFSTMSNGYGGYYVPQNAVGNNHEARGNFKNPNGYTVPAQCNTYSPHRRLFH